MTADAHDTMGPDLAPWAPATPESRDGVTINTLKPPAGRLSLPVSRGGTFESTGRIVGTQTVLLIDNYDSFTFNLFHRLGELGGDVSVYRNDALTAREALALGHDVVVISPGPCDPDRAGISLEVIRQMAGTCPVLGVCLGHQAIGQAFGGRVVRAPEPMHGKISLIYHDSTGIFTGAPNPFPATRYHSLVVERDGLPSNLLVNAWTEDGLIMGLRHRDLPIHGVQFHPESIETPIGYVLLRNFLALTPHGVWQ